MHLPLNISNKYKHLGNTRSHFRKIGRDAYTDWAIIIFIFCITMSIFICIGYRVFVKTNSDMQASPNKIITHKLSFDEDLMSTVLSAYEMRASESMSLKAGYSGPSDPLK